MSGLAEVRYGETFTEAGARCGIITVLNKVTIKSRVHQTGLRANNYRGARPRLTLAGSARSRAVNTSHDNLYDARVINDR